MEGRKKGRKDIQDTKDITDIKEGRKDIKDIKEGRI